MARPPRTLARLLAPALVLALGEVPQDNVWRLPPYRGGCPDDEWPDWPDPLEDDGLTDPARAYLDEHPLGAACMQAAERLEEEVGLFDHPYHSRDHVKHIASRLAALAVEVTGQRSASYEGAVLRRLTGLDPHEHFGCSGACAHLLRLHGERL